MLQRHWVRATEAVEAVEVRTGHAEQTRLLLAEA
jgi:hypothetical protein